MRRVSLARRGRWRGARILLLALASTLGACGGPHAPQPGPLPGAHTRHVIIVSIDGLRPDAVAAAPAPTVQRLAREGTWAAEAWTIEPASTLPAHTSMLTGVPLEQHGIDWNTDRMRAYGPVRVPTVFEIARERGLSAAAFVGKRKLRHLLAPGSLDWAIYPRTLRVLTARQVTEEFAEYLQFERPNLVFIHFPDTDLAGHAFGWMSRAYLRAVRRTDRAVAHVKAAADRAYGEDYVLIVTADHGGAGRGHAGGTVEERSIPWIAWGRGVVRGVIEEELNTYDTAATALWLLGVQAPAGWRGEPVRAAFRATPNAASRR